jgi:esterase/lipase
MSSTLFGRGTHTQVGVAHRAEVVNRELNEIKELIKEVREIPDTVRELKEMVLEMRQRLDTMNVPELVPQVKQEQLDDIENKIEALKVLQAPQVTVATLQALERRLEKKICAASATTS